MKRGWTGELGGQNRNIFFMRQLLGRLKLKDTIKHLLTEGPRLILILTGVVNQHQSQCCAFFAVFLWACVYLSACLVCAYFWVFVSVVCVAL